MIQINSKRREDGRDEREKKKERDRMKLYNGLYI